MELEVGDKPSGRIWSRTPRAPNQEGLLLKIKHSAVNVSVGSTRVIRFMKSSFDHSSHRFIACNQIGNVYLFDLSKNTFSLVHKTGQPCTAISLHHQKHVLVGLVDNSLKMISADNGDLLALMKGHKAVIHSISVHGSGRWALTTSSETANLWDLDTFQKKHKLNIREDVGLLQAFFLPNSNTIMTCFCDNTIFAWDLDSMSCKYQLPIPPGDSPAYQTFAVSQDSRFLVAGSKSKFLHLWSLVTKTLLRVIELPAKVKAIKQLQFFSCSDTNGISQVLGILSPDGIFRVINIDTCKLLLCVGSSSCKIQHVAVAVSGHHLVAVTEEGCLHLYSLDTLVADLTKPAPPTMKVDDSSSIFSESTGSQLSTRLLHRPAQSKKGGSDLKVYRPGHDKLDEEYVDPEVLNKEKLLNILKAYGEYPAKYRKFIWQKILHLPDNYAAYAALIDKGVHPAYAKLHEVYPLKSQKLLRTLQRILSALAHWSPIIGETQYIPSLAFPFVRLFQNNHLVGFELIVTIIVNWSQHWFQYFPHPPINILAMTENLLAENDLQLLQHYVKYGVTSQVYAWPLLETVFSEVLTQDEWLMMWDNVLSNQPAFLVVMVVAYNMCARAPLLKCTEMEDFQFFFHHRNALNIKQVIAKAYSLMEAKGKDNSVHQLEEFVPLAKGSYPIFNKYPHFIVDYQVQEKERIRKAEVEYLKQKNVDLDVQKAALRKNRAEEQWYLQKRLLLEAEEKRRRMIQDEEKKLTEQRKRLLALNQEKSLKELVQLEAGRQRLLQMEKSHQELQLKHLDDELQWKALLRDEETEAAIGEADIRLIKSQFQKPLDQVRDEHSDSHEISDRTRTEASVNQQGRMLARNPDFNHENLLLCDSIETVSFERNRDDLDNRELSLLQEVRQLRQKLAKDNRNKRPVVQALSPAD